MSKISNKKNNHNVDRINEALEKFQYEMENQVENGRDSLLSSDKLNTLQENLTKIYMDTVEDLPFSKFLVIIIL